MSKLLPIIAILCSLALWSGNVIAGPTSAFKRVAGNIDGASTARPLQPGSLNGRSSSLTNTAPPTPARASNAVKNAPAPSSPLNTASNGRAGHGATSGNGNQVTMVTRQPPKSNTVKQATGTKPKPKANPAAKQPRQQQVKPDAKQKQQIGKADEIKRNTDKAQGIQKKVPAATTQNNATSVKASGAAVDKIGQVNLSKVDPRTKRDTLAVKKSLQDNLATQKGNAKKQLNKETFADKRILEKNITAKKSSATEQLNQKTISDKKRFQENLAAKKSKTKEQIDRKASAEKKNQKVAADNKKKADEKRRQKSAESEALRSEKKSLADQAAGLIPKNGGKSRVELRSSNQKMDVDLAGASHAGIPTPHTRISPRNPTAPNQPAYNTSNSKSKLRSSTQEDLRIARRYLEKNRK